MLPRIRPLRDSNVPRAIAKLIPKAGDVANGADSKW